MKAQVEIYGSAYFSERLRSLMSSRGVTQAAVASGAGLSQPTISRYLSAQSEPKLKDVAALADYFGMGVDAFLGRPPLPDEPVGPQKAYVFQETHVSNGAAPFGAAKNVPVIAWARAGQGGYYEDQGLDVPHVPTTCKDPNCYAVAVEGDSMEPLYKAGDVLVVAPNTEARNGDLVLVKTKEDEVLFKKLVKRGDIIQLVSFNPDYYAREFKPKDLRLIHPIHSVIRPLHGSIF